jgi:hypothetical protein
MASRWSGRQEGAPAPTTGRVARPLYWFIACSFALFSPVGADRKGDAYSVSPGAAYQGVCAHCRSD